VASSSRPHAFQPKAPGSIARGAAARGGLEVDFKGSPALPTKRVVDRIVAGAASRLRRCTSCPSTKCISQVRLSPRRIRAASCRLPLRPSVQAAILRPISSDCPRSVMLICASVPRTEVRLPSGSCAPADAFFHETPHTALQVAGSRGLFDDLARHCHRKTGGTRHCCLCRKRISGAVSRRRKFFEQRCSPLDPVRHRQ